jgi:hypothetical protein
MLRKLALFSSTFAAVAVLASIVQAAPPVAPADKAKIIGQPTALIVQPASVTLAGPRAVQQLVVTGKYADGLVRDLTPFVDVKVEGPQVAVEDGLFLSPLKDGGTNIIIQAGNQKAVVPVTVKDMEKPQPVSFNTELIAALNVGGCNQGACHGTPSGKNGFKLSLRGYDPAADHVHLTHDVLSRRSDRQAPEASLMYLKALGRVPHDGGVRYSADMLPARTMYTWLLEGSKNDPPAYATLKKVEVLPGGRVLNQPSRWQQLSVLGHFSDGSVRDVTRLTVFSSSENALASVSATGLVEFSQAGEVAILCRYLEEMVPVRITYLEPKPGLKWNNPPENNYVDKHIFSKLKMLDILPSEVCSDQEFVRRAFMDACGVLPKPEEAKAFLDSKEPNKRAKLIDQLLERPEYADFWTLKWSDVLRSSTKTLKAKGVVAFHGWVRKQVAENVSFDKITRELITGSGDTFANPAASYYRVTRDPTSLAETTAQLFFGIRMQCSKCHNHPFERWTQDDYYSLSAFFSQVKLKNPPPTFDAKDKDKKKPITDKNGPEIVYVDKSVTITHPRTGKAASPKFLGGIPANADDAKDRRESLAAWLSSPTNPFVPKSVVNRIWFHVVGRGIVDPVDDFRDSNPSANDALLEALAKDFVDKKFDMKHVIRTIMNSRTYQLSAQTNEFNKDDNKYFSHALTRLYTAEPLFDALCYVTDVPEKFPNVPPGTRAVQLPDSENAHPFLKAFGQPARELACECERETDSNLTQALQLINGPAINDRLRNPANRIGKLLTAKKSNDEILGELFMVALSRPPSAAEAKGLLEHVTRTMDKRKAWEDVMWALINSKEFQFRH